MKTEKQLNAEKLFLNRIYILGNISNNVFVKVKVIEVDSKVPGTYGSKDNIGLRAISADGTEYTCNWGSFDDLSMRPYYSWFGDKENEGLMYDVTLTKFNSEYLYLIKLLVFKYPDILYRCDLHGTLNYIGNKCYYCHIEELKNCAYLRIKESETIDIIFK